MSSVRGDMIHAILLTIGLVCFGAAAATAVSMHKADASSQQHLKPGFENRVSRLVPFRWFDADAYTHEGDYWRGKAIRRWMWTMLLFVIAAVFIAAVS
jgi:hypothetical protein